jgi:ADP-heptose:LPS heptosyltransferase
MRRLVIDCARVGDLVLLTPILRCLAGHGDVDVLGRPWARAVLADQPGLGAIEILPDPNAAVWKDWLAGGARRCLGAVLAGRGYDEIVAFQGEGRHLRRWLTGWAGSTPIRWITYRNDRGLRHRVDAGAAALAGAGLPTDGYDPRCRLDVPPHRLATARERLAPLGRRVIAVQAGSSLTHRWFRRRPNLKGLAAAQWARLITAILEAGDADAAVLHGSAPEGREARAVIAALLPAVAGRVHDWTGRVPLAELPAILAAHHAVLSVDTGPAHIAAAVGAPVLAVFGPTDPGVFRPVGMGPVEILQGAAPCMPCHGGPGMDRCRANVCLTGVPDVALVAAWQRLRARLGAGCAPV